jgi:hypothetical protein
MMGRGAGGDGAGGEGCAEFGPLRRLFMAGETRPRQHRGGQGQAAPGFGGADPQPGTKELGGVPVPVIRRIRGCQIVCVGGMQPLG